MPKSGQLKRALFIKERKVSMRSLPYLFKGLKRIKTWKELSGFKEESTNFERRLALADSSYIKFCLLIADPSPQAIMGTQYDWLQVDNENPKTSLNHSSLTTKSPSLRYYLERGIVSPFNSLVCKSVHKVQIDADITLAQVEPFLPGILSSIEQITKRAFILDLNIQDLQGQLKGNNETERFQYFVKGFEAQNKQHDFFNSYPVLYRAVQIKLKNWRAEVNEFMQRLRSDRQELASMFGVSPEAIPKSIMQSGDTHNNGRAVFIVEFDNSMKIVYKPRSVKLELGFQKYIKLFNSFHPELKLRTIEVLDKGIYGWVEFVHFKRQQTQVESDSYHFKLGFLTALVYSLNGVDIFFENLVAAGADPVIIDLETLFHTSVDLDTQISPSTNIKNFIASSVAGIGILPRPIAGATDDQIFDVSVMGARTNAQAPYKVPSFKNFQRSDMQITEVDGWIPENNAASGEEFSTDLINRSFYSGLTAGFECLISNKTRLTVKGGDIDRCFSGSTRRLIVRDTKTYGALQQYENHPDFLRDQVDREWYWDNLWSELNERRSLSYFIESELAQVSVYDIPYFYGNIETTSVMGGDGRKINLTEILSKTPLEKVKDKIRDLDAAETAKQQKLTATLLGMKGTVNVSAPKLSPAHSFLENATSVARFVVSRLEESPAGCWTYTAYNPVPRSSENLAVNISPCDISLYDGMAGVAFFLHKTWIVTQDKLYYSKTVEIVESIFREIEANKINSGSGFIGLASVLYVVNKLITERKSAYSNFEVSLNQLANLLPNVVDEETQLDFLVGLAGIACAVIPYTKRTNSSLGQSILTSIMQRLLSETYRLLVVNEPIIGMSYMRGLSHGISGISLALYRLGAYFGNSRANEIAGLLLRRESNLVDSSGWTDSHMFAGQPLVGWCHGSAGVALTLSEVPGLLVNEPTLKKYHDSAVSNTLAKGRFSSMCLCHGSLGNTLCLRSDNTRAIQDLGGESEKDVLHGGFESLDLAQTLGIGLMTGLAGVGYYFLTRSSDEVDIDFLTLA